MAAAPRSWGGSLDTAPQGSFPCTFCSTARQGQLPVPFPIVPQQVAAAAPAPAPTALEQAPAPEQAALAPMQQAPEDLSASGPEPVGYDGGGSWLPGGTLRRTACARPHQLSIAV